MGEVVDRLDGGPLDLAATTSHGAEAAFGNGDCASDDAVTYPHPTLTPARSFVQSVVVSAEAKPF